MPKIICGAKARQRNGLPCRQPAMKNGRCRLHGGKSTGPKTAQGKLNSARSNYKNGFFTNEAIAERAKLRSILRWKDDLKDI